MLLRDLDWQPREAAHFYDCVALHCTEGTLYLERSTENTITGIVGIGIAWCPGARRTAPSIGRGTLPEPYTWHWCDDTLSAQGVLDHYTNAYGLLEKVT